MERSLSSAVVYGVVVFSAYLTHALASSEYMEKTESENEWHEIWFVKYFWACLLG